MKAAGTDLGRILRMARRGHPDDLTQVAAGNMVGIKGQTVSRWESQSMDDRTILPDPVLVMRLMRMLGYTSQTDEARILKALGQIISFIADRDAAQVEVDRMAS